MNLYERYFYFGKDNSVEEKDVPTVGWQDIYLYRFRIDEENEQVFLETKDGQSTPVNFEHVYLALAHLQQVQQVMLASLIGAPNPYEQSQNADNMPVR